MNAKIPFLVRYLVPPPDLFFGSGEPGSESLIEMTRPTDPTQDRTSPPVPPPPGTTFTRVERETTDDN